MRKILLLAFVAMAAAAALGLNATAQAQMMGGYGGGYGPGMMYGYGPDGRSYRGGQAYRGKRLCWHPTGPGNNAGYYEPCKK